MEETQAWELLAQERRAFADLLEGLDESQWETPSLCGSWSVADVATHMMVGQTGSLAAFATAMLQARGRFARANEVMVERKRDRPRSAIVADLRDHAEHRFTPPGAGWRAPVADFLVHRLDVCVPLGIDHGRPLDLWPDALELIVSPAARRGFIDGRLPSLAYAAPDVGWAAGEGDRVEAPAESLALALTRRPTDRLADLRGPGADALRAWATR